MKTKILFFLPVFIISFFCFSCEKTQGQTDTTDIDTTEITTDTTEITKEDIYPMEIPYEEVFSYYGTRYAHNYTSEGQIFIINSNEELETYAELIRGNNCIIDFSKHTLLLACATTPGTPIEKHTVEILKTSENSYTANIKVLWGSSLRATDSWTVALCVPKIAGDAAIELNTERLPVHVVLWPVKAINISGELTELPPLEGVSIEDDIRFVMDDFDTLQTAEIKSNVITFRSVYYITFEVKGNKQISVKNIHPGTKFTEDRWGEAFLENLNKTVRYDNLNNELIFFDSENSPLIVFRKLEKTI